ncbi:Hypothetical predicted protein [Pelobates cultripes]|uniref:Uncharacterized protein n=1 Tax=Pelobates cultripes TaxID=61616 RepID=A0AAD1W9W8_PELCU|nr:Hypothetical predicted protein [Pelobates cultripes]
MRAPSWTRRRSTEAIEEHLESPSHKRTLTWWDDCWCQMWRSSIKKQLTSWDFGHTTTFTTSDSTGGLVHDAIIDMDNMPMHTGKVLSW